jgi:large subunit ribosomal protein L6
MYFKELRIPEGVKIELTDWRVRVLGPKGELEREFKGLFGLKIERAENRIRVSSESERREKKALVGTVIAHIRNMCRGVTKGYTYKLRAVYSHFPMKITVEGDRVLIHNFLGERKPRVAKIVGDTEVKVEGLDITVTGINKEDVGLTSSNLEQSTRIKGRDRRVFQDGIWLIAKE